MEYVNCKQKSSEWGISERRVRQLCNEGRIANSYKNGSIWMIPQNAIKPVDSYKKELRKSVLITGASRGIGKATAIKFLENGWLVYGSYFKSLDNMRDLIKKYPKTFIPVGSYDLSSIQQINEFIDNMKKYKFDAMFMNAGIFSENDDFINFDLNDFNSVMNCNFYAPLMITIQLKDYINNNGSIVLMSSNDAYSGAFSSISYSVSKQAILNLVKSLSVNFGRKRVRVNSISPGAIDTDMNTPEQVNESPKWTPLQRVAQPYEVANVVFFLCGEESSFINGENITIDGGYGNVSVLLQKEMESSRVNGGYEELIKRYDVAKAGETIYAIDVPDLGRSWIEKQSEIDYLDSIVNAQKRGVNCYRFIILPEKDFECFVNKNKVYLKYKALMDNVYVVKKEELKNKLYDVYNIIDSGFDVYIDKDNNKSCFIDFYSFENALGVLTNNDKICDNLYEKMIKLKKFVDSKQ